jgi:hypothetical protein
MVSDDSKLSNSARNTIKKIVWRRRKTAVFGGSGGQIAVFYFKLFLLTHHKRFCYNIFKSSGDVLNLRYTLINENLKKMTKSPAGLVIREKFFRKKNMVSNDSKLSNSARNAIKNFFWRRRKTAVFGGSGGHR